MVTWTLTLCSVAFQPWSFRVWTGAVPSSGPSQDQGEKMLGLPSGCAQKEWETPPQGVGNAPQRSRKHSPEEQELWEAGGALLSRTQVISCVQPYRNPKSFPFFCARPCPSPPPGARRAQGPACGLLHQTGDVTVANPEAGSLL